MSKVVSPEQVLLEVSENYKRLETSIVNQLWMQASNHYPTDVYKRQVQAKPGKDGMVIDVPGLARGHYMVYARAAQEMCIRDSVLPVFMGTL